jgi:hypothetical protein
MKKIVSVTEVDGEGLVGLMGETVMLFCLNYIYTGTLAGVNDTCVLLENPAIVYETGAFSDKSFKDKQPLPFQLYVQLSALESFGKTDKR